MLNEEKVAQMAAYLLTLRGGQMSYLKLMKLLYTADRLSVYKYDFPMSGDKWVSMDKGPVLSSTLDLIQGGSTTGEWNSWIAPVAGEYEVTLCNRECSRDSFDELSDSDIEILGQVWNELGSLGRWQVVDYTHTHYREWKDPHGSSLPISPKDMLLALGRSEDEADFQAAIISQRDELQRIMGQMV